MADQPPVSPPSAEDLLEADHEVRRLWSLVDGTVGESLRKMAMDRGGILHDPARMFAVWMYALMKGDGSSRKLEELCRYDLRYGYLCGGVRPDHATLARFRRRFESFLPELLQQVCEAGRASGLLGSRPLAIDGTKVSGARSQWSRALSKAEAFDSDSSKMADGHGGFVVGYNAQVASDTVSTFIAGSYVTDEANDQHAMGPVLQAVESQSGELPPSVVADTGYDTSSNHGALSERGVTGYVHPHPGQSTVFRRGEDGLLRCRAGHVPHLSHTLKRGVPFDVYRVFKCAGCPFRTSCPGKGSRRQMAVQSGTAPELRTENAERCESEEGQLLLRLRGPTVELVFARLKAMFGFRRFSLRNLSGARLEFALLVLAYDLWLLKELFIWLMRLLWASREPRNAGTAA